MSFGPKPWKQQHWDERAATNFTAGGIGGGLVVVTALLALGGAPSKAALVIGMAIMALGLTTVWFEIGRPLRALNVYINLRQSWMTREAYVAGATFALGALAWWTGAVALFVAAGATAAVFVYCQARMLRRSVGIPAWREPSLVRFILATALVEGLALGLILQLVMTGGAAAAPAWGLALALATAARYLAWRRYRALVEATLVPAARRAIAGAHSVAWIYGTVVPIVLAGSAAWPAYQTVPLGVAALLALLTGARIKWIVLTQADYNQGFGMPHLPVRGVRMTVQGGGDGR